MPEKYTVEQGECINSIAFEKGFSPDTLWNHPDNKQLKDLRKDPAVLLPGDIVTIPDKKIKEVSKPPEKLHKFKRKGVPKFLRVRLMELEKPLANWPCKIWIDDQESDGKTDGDGWLKHPIPPNAKEAVLRFDGAEYRFDLGHLDPIETTSGLQGRLKALGFFDGAVDGVANEETAAAIKAFQRANGLKVSGEADQATRDKLKQKAGA